MKFARANRGRRRNCTKKCADRRARGRLEDFIITQYIIKPHEYDMSTVRKTILSDRKL